MAQAQENRDRSSSLSARPSGRAAAALLGLALLGACSSGDEVRITTCTSVVAAINVDAHEIEILSTTVDSDSGAARISYRAQREGLPNRLQWVECHFGEIEFPQLVAELIAVDTSDGPLGKGRLFVLKRWWLNDDPETWQSGDT